MQGTRLATFCAPVTALLVAGALALLPACGDDDDDTGAPPSTSSAPPATSAT